MMIEPPADSSGPWLAGFIASRDNAGGICPPDITGPDKRLWCQGYLEAARISAEARDAAQHNTQTDDTPAAAAASGNTGAEINMGKMKEAAEEAETVATDDPVQFKAEELVANMSSTIVDWFKAQAKPWSLMTYEEQQGIAVGAHKLSRQTVTEAVRVIAAEDRRVIVANVEQVTFKDGIKATLKASQHSEFRHELADATGMDVLIVVADAAEFDQVGGAPEPDAPKDNQHDLIPEDDRPVFDNTKAAA